MNIYQLAVATFGSERQKKQAIEELSELSLALIHSMSGKATQESVIDEVVDVIIMMRQLTEIYGEEAINSRIEYKLDRLKARIASGYYD